MLTGYLGRIAEKGFQEMADRDANLTSSFLHHNLDDAENAAKSLGPSDAIVAALSSGRSTDLVRANLLLDRINRSFGMTVCYLLDSAGLTVASSNTMEATGFMGESFADSPYFKGAVKGVLTKHFAIDATSGERGYYAAAPVSDSRGRITGVVVVKSDVAPVEELFRKYTRAFLVSPEGVIFIASRKDLLFSCLWPVDQRRRSELLASRQFGELAFEPLLATEPLTRTHVSFDNEKLYLLRLPFGSDGWTIVLMEKPRIVSDYRWFGVLLTTVFVLLILVFYNVLLNKEKSLEVAKELLKSMDHWKRTFDLVPDLIANIDSDHRIVRMNRAMAERLGMSPQEAVGRDCHELLHGTGEPLPSCPHRRTLASGESVSVCLLEKNLNGNFIVTTSPILAGDGTIESTIHVMHDITELKLLEASLKENAQRLEFVLEGSNDATWEWDMITNQNVLNARYYEMIEYSPGEVDPDFTFFIKTVHPDDLSHVQGRLQEILDGNTSKYEAQYRMVTKAGKIRLVMGRGKVVRYDEAGRPTKMAGVVTDVTEMKRLSEEANRISNLASIGLLAGGLAHDFNNVLNVICGNVTFAKMLTGDGSSITESLTDAEEACQRAKELGVRLQALSQGNSPAREPIALPAIIEDVAGILLGSGILHTISADDDILPLEADLREIRQVFGNLLTNAKEAMPEGGTIQIFIENFVVDDKEGLPLVSGPYVRISFQDCGKGILAGNLPRIFDPYFSTKETYSHRGMGLGLSICHAVLKRHSGHISVASDWGIGTRVAIYLPAFQEISAHFREV